MNHQTTRLSFCVFAACWVVAIISVTTADAQTCENITGIYDGLFANFYDYEPHSEPRCTFSNSTQRLVWHCVMRFCRVPADICDCNGNDIRESYTDEYNVQKYCWTLKQQTFTWQYTCCPGYELNQSQHLCFLASTTTTAVSSTPIVPSVPAQLSDTTTTSTVSSSTTSTPESTPAIVPPSLGNVVEPSMTSSTLPPTTTALPLVAAFPYQYIAAIVVGALLLLLLPLLLLCCIRRRKRPLPDLTPTDAFANAVYDKTGLPAYAVEVKKGKKDLDELVVEPGEKKMVPVYETIPGDSEFSDGDGLAVKAKLARQKAEESKVATKGTFANVAAPKPQRAMENEYVEIGGDSFL